MVKEIELYEIKSGTNKDHFNANPAFLIPALMCLQSKHMCEISRHLILV